MAADVSRAIEQCRNLSYVKLFDCCMEINKGVIEGLRRRCSKSRQLSPSPPQGDTTIRMHIY